MEREPTAEALACAECGRQPRDDENAADEWRAYLDVDDDLRCSARSAPSAGSPALPPALNGQVVDGCVGFWVGEHAAIGLHQRKGEVTSPAEAFVSG